MGGGRTKKRKGRKRENRGEFTKGAPKIKMSYDDLARVHHAAKSQVYAQVGWTCKAKGHKVAAMTRFGAGSRDSPIDLDDVEYGSKSLPIEIDSRSSSSESTGPSGGALLGAASYASPSGSGSGSGRSPSRSPSGAVWGGRSPSPGPHGWAGARFRGRVDPWASGSSSSPRDLTDSSRPAWASGGSGIGSGGNNARRRVGAQELRGLLAEEHGGRATRGPNSEYHGPAYEKRLSVATDRYQPPLPPPRPEELDVPTGNVGLSWLRPTDAPPRSDMDCSICMDTVHMRDAAYVTDCGHVFHRVCLDTWKRTKANQGLTCPTCRSGVTWNIGRFPPKRPRGPDHPPNPK